MGNSIEVKNIYKKFRLFHEKRDTIYEIFVGALNRKKYYEDLEVLKNVSFEVKKGEVFGIVGRNGAGKTTLLRIISGIYGPDKGKVTVKGKILPILGLGAGFEIDLTARDNVIQYGVLLGFKKKEIMERVEKVMKFAELERFADVKLKNFSTGMYARLAFSTGLQVDPDIILIDEVLLVGDMGFQKKCFDSINELRKKGKTIIIVTHETGMIKKLCDRAMLLNNGQIKEIGDPENVIEELTKLFSKE